MKQLIQCAVVLGLMSSALAANTDRPEPLTHDMIVRAIDHYARVGPSQSAIDFNRKSEAWYQEENALHMLGLTPDGIVWADNVWPEFIGTDITLVADFRGVAFGRDIVENTPMDGSIYLVRLEFIDPETGHPSTSVGACARVDDGNILCSWSNG